MAVINSGRMLQVIVNLSIEGARKNAAYISFSPFRFMKQKRANTLR